MNGKLLLHISLMVKDAQNVQINLEIKRGKLQIEILKNMYKKL